MADLSWAIIRNPSGMQSSPFISGRNAPTRVMMLWMTEDVLLSVAPQCTGAPESLCFFGFLNSHVAAAQKKANTAVQRKTST